MIKLTLKKKKKKEIAEKNICRGKSLGGNRILKQIYIHFDR
jgi:hypothetical protein